MSIANMGGAVMGALFGQNDPGHANVFINQTEIRDNSKIAIDYSDPFFGELLDANKAVRPYEWGSLFPYSIGTYYEKNNGTLLPIEEFTLPITPTDLQIRMPFASQVTPTLKGIVEEHAGAPFREITFSGTTGILPGMGRPANTGYMQPSIAQSIFAGTLSQVGGLVTAAKSVASAFQGPQSKNQFGVIQTEDTGYFAFQMLYALMNHYALVKRGTNLQGPYKGLSPSKIRLLLNLHRENVSWVLTPREFSWRRSASDPHLYFYNFAGTAWKKAYTFDTDLVVGYAPFSQRPNAFQSALNSMHNAQLTVMKAQGLVNAVRGDITGRLLDPLRTTTLSLKLSVGVGRSLLDLPQNIKKDFQQTVARSWGNLRDSFASNPPSSGAGSKSDPQDLSKQMGKQYELSQNQTTDQTQPPPNSASPVGKMFSDPVGNPDFFDGINLSSLDTPPDLSNKVSDEEDRVGAFQQKDFETNRSNLISVSEEVANSMGLGSVTYSRLVGSDSTGTNITYVPPARIPNILPEQLDPLWAIQDAIQVLDSMVASGTIDDPQIISSMDFVAGLSQASNIPFDKSQSKFLVPVPYGFTIEAISNMYLRDPNRWSEIATLNGLRAPYIDETGFTIALLSNGIGNQISINPNVNLYVGQTIRLFSNTVPTFSRRISKIDQITDTVVLVTLDGDSNLDVLKSADKAKMQAFLPGTVNSELLIWIPSDVPAPTDPKLRSVPGIDDANALTKISGIDILLTSDGDLAITEDGDTRLAYGLVNIVQAARLKLSTPAGSLIQHPDYGFAARAGSSNADVSAQGILKNLSSQFKADSRFTGVSALSVEIRGPVMQINLTTGVAGVSALVPISVQVPV